VRFTPQKITPMNTNQANVMVITKLGAEGLVRGYTKAEAVALHGKFYAAKGAEHESGPRIGHIVGSLAYRYEGKPITYGLNAEYKHVDGTEVWPIWKGNFFRRDLENSESALIPKGKVAEQAEKHLRNKQAPSRELLQGLHVEVYAAQAMRKVNSQSRSF